MKRNLTLLMIMGLIWGILEASVGTFMHLLHFPFTGQIMSAVGFTIILVLIRKGYEVKNIPIVILMAALLKLSAFPFVIDKAAVIKPAISILLEGFAFIGILKIIKEFEGFYWCLISSYTVILFTNLFWAIVGNPLYDVRSFIGLTFIKPFMTAIFTYLGMKTITITAYLRSFK